VDVEVHGLDELQRVIAGDCGVLITPNHPTHADPFALLEISDRLRHPFYFMTAWQVFATTHAIGRRVLRQHGCFSVNREGYDLRAFRQATTILQASTHPLVIFPEGEVFHLNDRLTPFRRGAAAAAVVAARRADRPVACVPCAIRYHYVSDPMPKLLELMSRLEQRLGWTSLPEMPLQKRIHRLAEGLVGLQELEHLGATRSGRLSQRIEGLVATILGRLEERYQTGAGSRSVPERVKQLRYRVILRSEAPSLHPAHPEQLQQDMESLMRVTQLFSYPAEYLAGRPSVERLAETLDKLEEDLLGVPTAGIRGLRRAVVTFGSPIVVEPALATRFTSEGLTRILQDRVQSLLDHAGLPQPAISATDPAVARRSTATPLVPASSPAAA
jgi:1-acyl-sn-glycerol-3-phosphate acyltransferase